MKRLAAVLLVFVPWMVLTSVAAAQDVEAIKAVTLAHFAAFKAGDAAAHVRHHLAEHSLFDAGGGLLEEFDSLEEEENNLQADFAAGLKFNLQLRHLKVKVYGNTAVVTGYVVGTVTSPDGHRPREPQHPRGQSNPDALRRTRLLLRSNCHPGQRPHELAAGCTESNEPRLSGLSRGDPRACQLHHAPLFHAARVGSEATRLGSLSRIREEMPLARL